MTDLLSASRPDAVLAHPAIGGRSFNATQGDKVILDALDLDMMSGEILGLIATSWRNREVYYARACSGASR